MNRNSFFDNAKFILIFLVVFGHMVQPFTTDKAVIGNIYTWIYTYHMPLFIFLAGFFAKGAGNMSYIVRLAKKLIIPYIIFQILYTGYYYLIGKTAWLTSHLFYPHWSLWFLISLFCWHLLLVAYKRLKPMYAIGIAVTIGVVIGYFDQVGHLFSISRTFVFFPYFLIGYFVTEKQVMFVKSKQWKAVSAIILFVAFIIITIAPTIPVGWLLQSKPYELLGADVFVGLIRLSVYGISFIMGMSILAWIPEKRYLFTKLGERTLYVYLLHGFIVQLFREYELLRMTSMMDFFIVVVLSLIIVIGLSTRPVMVIWQPLVECSTSIWQKINKEKSRENMLSS